MNIRGYAAEKLDNAIEMVRDSYDSINDLCAPFEWAATACFPREMPQLKQEITTKWNGLENQQKAVRMIAVAAFAFLDGTLRSAGCPLIGRLSASALFGLATASYIKERLNSKEERPEQMSDINNKATVFGGFVYDLFTPIESCLTKNFPTVSLNLGLQFMREVDVFEVSSTDDPNKKMEEHFVNRKAEMMRSVVAQTFALTSFILFWTRLSSPTWIGISLCSSVATAAYADMRLQEFEKSVMAQTAQAVVTVYDGLTNSEKLQRVWESSKESFSLLWQGKPHSD